jgi:hypothetical protein
MANPRQAKKRVLPVEKSADGLAVGNSQADSTDKAKTHEDSPIGEQSHSRELG